MRATVVDRGAEVGDLDVQCPLQGWSWAGVANNEHNEQSKTDETRQEGKTTWRRDEERERRRRSGRMVVEEKREGMGGSVAHVRCFIGQGLAVSHGHSSTARIEILKPSLARRRQLPFADVMPTAEAHSLAPSRLARRGQDKGKENIACSRDSTGVYMFAVAQCFGR